MFAFTFFIFLSLSQHVYYTLSVLVIHCTSIPQHLYTLHVSLESHMHFFRSTLLVGIFFFFCMLERLSIVFEYCLMRRAGGVLLLSRAQKIGMNPRTRQGMVTAYRYHVSNTITSRTT